MDESIEVFKAPKGHTVVADEHYASSVTSVANQNPKVMVPTENAAKSLNVVPNTMRSAHSKQGHYMGIRPVKLPNRRLLWSAEAIEHLLKTGEAL